MTAYQIGECGKMLTASDPGVGGTTRGLTPGVSLMHRYPTIPRACLSCGTEFQALASNVRRGDGRYCSRKCVSLAWAATVADRFWAKVNKDGPVPSRRSDLGPCWIWTGATLRGGYGQFAWTENGRAVHMSAHRWAYRALTGPIPEQFHVDHLCRVPPCVNPGHLEPVTPRENLLRGENPSILIHLAGVCKRGHQLPGRWRCETCQLIGQRQRRKLLAGLEAVILRDAAPLFRQAVQDDRARRDGPLMAAINAAVAVADAPADPDAEYDDAEAVI